MGSYVPKTTKQVFSSLFIIHICALNLNSPFGLYLQVHGLKSKLGHLIKCIEVTPSF